MTTPNVTSPNVRIVPKELLVQPPEDAPLSTTPIAEAALAELLQGGRLGIRDMYRPVDALPEIITDDARSKWDALAEDVADGAESARMLLADWWRHGWAQTFQRPPFWVRPAAAPDPGAHPYPGAAPEAAAEDGESWLDKLADASRRAAEAKFGPMPHAPATAAPDAPAETGKTPGPPGSDQGVNETAEPAPAAEPEPAAGEPDPATDATAVLVGIAAEQEAATEPADATAVIEPAKAETEAMPAVPPEDGGAS